MVTFWKAAAVVVLTVILGAAVAKTDKDISVVLTASACCMIAILAVQMLGDIIAFLHNLVNTQNDQLPFADTVLKITGVALVSELTGLISADAGSSSLQKAINLLGNAVILSMALPLFEAFVEIVLEILNTI